MYISLNIKDLGETKLFIQPYDKKGDNNRFILIKDNQNINNPYLTLTLENNKFVINYMHDIVDDDKTLNEKLDALALEVIEALQQGNDIADTNLSLKEQPYNPDKIRVDTKNFSLKQIHDMIIDGDLNLHPDFQRNFVWDNFRKSRLIESILLRIPLPMFYFSQDEEGVLSVVDGLQRLSTIRDFMENKLELRNLEYLENCNGKYYSLPENKIEDKYSRWFNMTQIIVNIIDPQSPGKVKYDIFRRINTGGRPLNAQELRNCLAGNGLRKTLKEMSTLPSFIQATGNSISDVRMGAQELALRFILFRYLRDSQEIGIESYSGDMDEDLNQLVDIIGKKNDEELKKYVRAYDNAMNMAFHLFGRHTFRKVFPDTTQDSFRSVINKALFVSFSVVLSYCEESKIMALPENCMINKLAEAINGDDNYNRYISYGTNGKTNLMYAFEKAEELIRELLK